MVEAFRWILPGRLAGSGLPGLFNPLEADLEYIRSAGIRHVVSLTEGRVAADPEGEPRFHHFPIDDMGIPTPQKASEICDFVLAAIEREEPVLIHCKAGLGRTGTLLACCLIAMGSTPQQALARLRGQSPYYVQNQTQECFLEHFAEHVLGASQPRAEAWHEGVGMLVTDPRGRIRYADRIAGNLLGVWPAALPATNLFDHLEADWLAAALEARTPNEQEWLPAKLHGATSRHPQAKVRIHRIPLEPDAEPLFVLLLRKTDSS